MYFYLYTNSLPILDKIDLFSFWLEKVKIRKKP